VFSALIKVDGIGSALEDLLSSDPKVLAPSTEGTLHVFTCAGPAPMEGMKYVLAVDGRSLYIATSDNFLHECLDRKAGLDTNPDFTAALADLGPEGNGLTWVSPRFFTRLRQLPDMNPQASKEARQLLELYSSSIPASSQPILLVRTNLPDGILLRSTWNRSLKADLAMLTVYNPVTVGLLAAMAIPAFQKVRANSQAVAVTNNLRMLAAAADQYYLEHGATSATYDDLVGPDKYVKSVTPVAGEDYRSLKFVQGRPLRILLADGRVISYPRGGPHKMVTPPGAYPNLNTVPNFESPPITPPSKY
jgi:type IV pilus assembly protein PilA